MAADHDTRERWPTRAERERAADDAQTRIRRVIDALALARHELTIVIESGACHDVRSGAEDARDWVENAQQAADVALRFAVDASGVSVIERPVRAAAE
jgi:Fe-S cluster assembly iron-binding protein IscA